MKKIIHILILLLFSVLLTTCTKEEDNQPEITDETNILNEKAVVVTENNLGILENVSENELVFSNATVAMNVISEGAILVSDITEQAPEGFLRKVVSKTTQDGKVTLTTEPATLNDLFEQADIEYEYQISPIDTLTSNLKSAKTTDDLMFNIKVSKVIYDADNDYSTKNDQITVKGALKFYLTFVFEYKKSRDSDTPSGFVCKLKIEDNSELEYKVGVGYSPEKIKLFNPCKFNPIRVLVVIPGVPFPVPVIFTHEMNFYAGVKFEAGAKFSGGINSTSIFEVGVKYENNSFEDITNNEVKIDVPPPAFENAYFKGSLSLINPVYEIKPYGMNVFKGFLSADAGLKLTVKNISPQIKLDGIFGLSGGIKTKFFGFNQEYSLAYTLPAWEIYKGEIHTTPVLPTVTTSPIKEITMISAYGGGNVTDEGGAAVTARGLCINTSPNPTIDGSITNDGIGSGEFTTFIQGLNPYTTYHVRAYATNSVGTAYGEGVTFTTGTFQLPTVKTTEASLISGTTAQSGGNVTADGGSSVTEKGVCWSTNTTPTINDNRTTDGNGTGSFTSNITGLQPNTTYYLRAYAINSEGDAYGNEISFTTETEVLNPEISTLVVFEITNNSAVSGGNIISDGGLPISERGVCWSTNPNPTTNNNKTIDGTGTGIYTSQLSNLQANTTYYVRAYFTNTSETYYGEEQTFTTSSSEIFDGTVTDIDGNIYKAVQIGDQIWMAENLKVTKYNDGTDISNVIDNTEWSNLTTGAYCWYDNDEASYKNLYGALYNWFVAETGNICPTGWHVPSNEEWINLATYIYADINSDAIGTALKATTGWHSDGSGTDNYNFTALPAGSRNEDNGSFTNISLHGFWWSSTEYNNTNAWYRAVSYYNYNLYKNQHNKQNGFSIRCLKD